MEEGGHRESLDCLSVCPQTSTLGLAVNGGSLSRANDGHQSGRGGLKAHKHLVDNNLCFFCAPTQGHPVANQPAQGMPGWLAT